MLRSDAKGSGTTQAEVVFRDGSGKVFKVSPARPGEMLRVYGVADAKKPATIGIGRAKAPVPGRVRT